MTGGRLEVDLEKLNDWRLGNAIPDRFANPGISGLSLLNPGIPGLISGLNRARLWLAIAYSWSCNRQNSNKKDYKV